MSQAGHEAQVPLQSNRRDISSGVVFLNLTLGPEIGNECRYFKIASRKSF